jgi:hypothetical protein
VTGDCPKNPGPRSRKISSIAVLGSYTELSGGNNSRMTSMTYPNGKVLTFNYAGGLDSNISRLTSLSDSSGTLESYLYLGLDTVVQRTRTQENKRCQDPLLTSDCPGYYA